MVRRNWGISLLLISSLLGLTGCAEESAAKPKEKGTIPAQQPEKKPPEQQAQPAQPKPATVNVIDPNTKAILKTILPNEMGFESDPEAYKKELEEWARELARGTDTTPGYDQKMIPDRIDANGQIIKGRPRVILEESELVEKIVGASVNGGDVLLPIYVTESGYKPEDPGTLDQVLLGSYTTYFDSSVIGRSKNIELSAQAINNTIIGVQDSFSFNTTVGPSDSEHGYQPAKEIVNKQLVDGIGGGICQTSSTLFNAIDKVGVDYIEWNHHSLSVGYVPTGRDATVSYGGKDFQFQNTTGVPLIIKSIYQKGKLTVEVRTSAAYQTLYAQGN
ncbi:VanW family protein [Neobacillus muris]|uniref:VanW family protein n=1 Tax=Neobacillus muris TaxID=2941334 RepID=UPI0020410EA2|nr:VanW family protein [Neobacillus muris]